MALRNENCDDIQGITMEEIRVLFLSLIRIKKHVFILIYLI